MDESNNLLCALFLYYSVLRHDVLLQKTYPPPASEFDYPTLRGARHTWGAGHLVSWGSSGFFPVCLLSYCSSVKYSLKILNRVVSGDRIFTGCVFEFNNAHHWSVPVLCMLYNIRCKPMHPLYIALPVLYVPVWVTSLAYVAHRWTYAPFRCRTSLFRMTFIHLSVPFWNDLSGPAHVIDGVGL